MPDIKNAISNIHNLSDYKIYGQVEAIVGQLIEVGGIERFMSIGDQCYVLSRSKNKILCQVAGVQKNKLLVMPFGPIEGVGVGCDVEIINSEPVVYPHERWLGRVINGLGDPIDEGGHLPLGGDSYPLCNMPPPSHQRKRVDTKMDLGIRAMNSFLPCCYGQRMGIFAGSGVGKSILLSMLARHGTADVNVIGLIGERGREVREFIEDNLGEEGLKKSVIIVATSDQSALMRRQAAYLTMTVSEFFRDRGQQVLCLFDSVTRFAMAQREIGLSVNEPPTTKGYTPSVFTELPKLLERAGPGLSGVGDITGLFTVLVEGDDTNEPVSDTVRSILDGHIILDREIAERGRYPAINILKSISRSLPACHSEEQNKLITRAKRILAQYEDMAELIRIGAYNKGADPLIDEAIRLFPKLDSFLEQDWQEHADVNSTFSALSEILSSSKESDVE